MREKERKKEREGERNREGERMREREKEREIEKESNWKITNPLFFLVTSSNGMEK